MIDLFMLILGVVPVGVALFIISDFMLILRTPSHATLARAYRVRFPLIGLSLLLLGLLVIRAATGATEATWGWAAVISAAGLAGFAAAFYHPWVFRPVRHPRTISAEDARRILAPGDEVIGTEVGGEARAYPIPMVMRAHVVLDHIGDRPVAVTYCVLCNSAMAFDQRFAGRVIDLTPITARNNNIVYWDRTGRNLIQQMEGRIAWGPEQGLSLTPLPTRIMPWEAWHAQYPETTVFLNPPSSVVDAAIRKVMIFFGYTRYRTTPNPLFPLRRPIDRRLPSKEMVFSTRINGEARAYPIGLMRERRVINDRIGGTEVVVVYDSGRDCGGLFERRVGQQTLTFDPADAGKPEGAQFIDRQTGSQWDLAGRAVSGSMAGARLTPVPHFSHAYWFAWAHYHPDTRIGPASNRQPGGKKLEIQNRLR